MNSFISISFLIGMLFILFGAPYQYAKGVTILTYSECTAKDKVKCAIPIYNMFYGENLYDGGKPLVGIASLLFFVFFILRFVVIFVASTLYFWNVLTMSLVIAAVLFWYIASFRATYKIIKDADTKSVSATIVYSLLFPLGQYYIGSHVVTETKNRMKQQETF